MRIQAPTITQITELKGEGASLTGSFSGSFNTWEGISGKPDPILSSSAQIADDISGSLSTEHVNTKVPGLVSGSAQIADDISGSLSVTHINTKAPGLVSGSAQIADDISGSLSVTHVNTKVPGLLSGSAQIADNISGSFTDASASLAADIVTNDSDISGLNSYTSSLKTAITVSGADVTVQGDLTVQGDTTTLNTATLEVEDLNITVARNAGSAAAANGAGLTVAGASATLTYASTGDKWVFNKVVDVPTSGLLVNGTAVTSTAAELNLVDGSSAGTVVNSKGVIYSAGGKVNATQFQIGGVDVDNDIATLSLPASTTISTFGASLVDDADAGAARTTLGLGTAATTAATDYATAAQGTTADAALPKAGGQMTGNITFSGTQTVDGRDLSVDGAKLDGIAAGATNVTNNNQITNGAGYTTYTANQGLDNNDNVHFEGLMVGQTSGATANTIRCVGDIVAYYSSDAQFKDNVTQLEGALDKVKQIRGVSFDWNDKQDVYEGHDIGVIAQEVQAVYPELVHHRDHNNSLAVDYVKLTAVLIEAVKELSAKVDELSK